MWDKTILAVVLLGAIAVSLLFLPGGPLNADTDIRQTQNNIQSQSTTVVVQSANSVNHHNLAAPTVAIVANSTDFTTFRGNLDLLGNGRFGTATMTNPVNVSFDESTGEFILFFANTGFTDGDNRGTPVLMGPYGWDGNGPVGVRTDYGFVFRVPLEGLQLFTFALVTDDGRVSWHLVQDGPVTYCFGSGYEKYKVVFNSVDGTARVATATDLGDHWITCH